MQEQMTLGDRLKWAITTYGPRPPRRPGADGSINEFSARLEDHVEPGGGASYATIWRIIAGKAEPSDAFISATLEVLREATGQRVRREWLVEGEEPPTVSDLSGEDAAEEAIWLGGLPLEEYSRRHRSTREEALKNELGRPIPAVAKPVLHKALGRIGLLERFREEGLYEGQGQFRSELAERLGRAIAAPLEAFGIEAESCDGAELADYLVTTTTALARLVDHTVRNAPRLEEARKKIEQAKRHQPQGDTNAKA